MFHFVTEMCTVWAVLLCEEEVKEVGRAWIGLPAVGGSGFQGFFLGYSETVRFLGQ